MDQAVHGALAVVFTILTAGMFYFSNGLGWRRPTTVIAFLTFCLALVFLCQAAMIDGFVAPALAQRCGLDAACGSSVGSLLFLGSLQIEFLTRFGLVAIATAILGWAVGLLTWGRDAKIAGGLGFASAAGQFWLLFGFAENLTPSSLLPIVLLQAVWYAVVSV